MVSLLTLVALGGRQIVDLNAGWEFARVPNPPSVWRGNDAVPTTGWRVLNVSSEETSGEDARATKAFDGKPETFWHTEWSKRQAPYPHSISIDLGARTEVVGLRILTRQTGPQNGRPRHFQMLLTDGRDDSAPPVVSEVVPDASSLYKVRFPAAKGRFLRLNFLDGHRPEPYLALAEIGLIRPTKQGSDWASQYNVESVLRGDARFDPSPADLDRLRVGELKAIKGWQSATLPHAAWARPLNDAEIWQGVAYYRRHLPVPTGRTELVLQGMQNIDVWLNGRYLAGRRGGYLPLRTPIREGGDLLVRVDNSDNPLIPPGKPQSQLDFMYGLGLYAGAFLERTDSVHITDDLSGGGIRVDPPNIGPRAASTWIHTEIRNDGSHERSLRLVQTLFDPTGKHVARAEIPQILLAGKAEKIAQRMTIPHRQLWSPDSPARYRLVTSIEENGRVVDSRTTRLGLRTIAVSREKGLLLNGKPLRLVGTNRHQDYPWVGPALSDAAQRRDALLIKRSGHNIVRLSHYNQSPAFLDACDEFGILTIPCIPGWQFINRDPRFTQRVIRDIRETVRRDRNHPCVAWWEASLNETYPPAELAKAWYAAAHDEGAALVAGDDGKDVPWDVIYNGWREDLSRPSNPTRPGYIREYGDYEFGGGASSSRVKIGAGLGKLLDETWNHVWSYNKFRPLYPSTMGAGTWEMFDHNVPWEFAVSASGLADLMRREKPSFWFYASQAAKRPYLKIAADWQSGPKTRRVVAFTNASSATLYVNGKALRTETATRGGETPYDLRKAFDGTNTSHLPHPPIVFDDVPFTAGELKVAATNGVRDVIRTAGRPVRLKLWVDDLGVRPTPNDLVFVRAAIVDGKGVICSGETRRIGFSGVQFAGESLVETEMGVASVLVRTSMQGGRVVVSAKADGLTGRCEFTVGGGS